MSNYAILDWIRGDRKQHQKHEKLVSVIKSTDEDLYKRIHDLEQKYDQLSNKLQILEEKYNDMNGDINKIAYQCNVML